MVERNAVSDDSRRILTAFAFEAMREALPARKEMLGAAAAYPHDDGSPTRREGASGARHPAARHENMRNARDIGVVSVEGGDRHDRWFVSVHGPHDVLSVIADDLDIAWNPIPPPAH